MPARVLVIVGCKSRSGVSLVRVRCRARVASIALVACTARAVRYLSSRSPCRIARDAYLARVVPCGLRLSQVGGCDSHESALAKRLVLAACSPSPFLHLGFPTVVFTCVKGTPMYGLKTESSFDAAHFLTDYHGKCENLHGHRWRVVAYLEQEELQTQGTHKDMVIDFADFKGALRDLTEAFDHSFVVEEGSLAPDTLACLEREGFSLSVVPFRTTAENLARYFYGKLADAGFPVSQVDVYETPNNCAIYRG